MLSDVAEETILAVPDFAGAYIWRGIVEMSHGEAGKAEVDFNKALSLAPQDWQAHLQLGNSVHAERFPEGVVLLEKLCFITGFGRSYATDRRIRSLLGPS